MPTRWLFLRGAPSSQNVLLDASKLEGRRSRVLHSPPPTQTEQWQTLHETVPQSPPDSDEHSTSANAVVEETQDVGALPAHEDQTAILAMLLEQSRAIAEESQSRSQLENQTDYLAAPAERSRQANQRQVQVDPSEDSFSESLLPPPTQQRSRMLGDASRSFGGFGNITEEQSLLNLPSWSFQISSLTQLNNLPSSNGKNTYTSPRVNILAFIDELELPSTMPAKNPSRGGKTEYTRAGMTLVDESGASLQIVMWDDYAEEWAGRHLMRGDVIYVERIALSEYKGQRQGSTVNGSKVQICYRTVERHNGRKTDPALRPQLDLDWDPISQRVRLLAQLATEL